MLHLSGCADEAAWDTVARKEAGGGLEQLVERLALRETKTVPTTAGWTRYWLLSHRQHVPGPSSGSEANSLQHGLVGAPPNPAAPTGWPQSCERPQLTLRAQLLLQRGRCILTTPAIALALPAQSGQGEAAPYIDGPPTPKADIFSATAST